MSCRASRLLIFCAALAVLAFAGGAEAQSAKFRPHKFNGTAPVIQKGVYTFQLVEGRCSSVKYGDGRGESDCANGAYRSRVIANKQASVGQTWEYSFEFRVDPSFVYDGGKTPETSRLKIAEWGRSEGIKNHLYDIHLDSRRGATFERQPCVPASRLTQWNTFRLRVKWSASGDGYLVAECNGKVVLERVNQQTIIPPDCGKPWKLQCKLELQQPRSTIYWQVGPHLSGYGTTFAQIGKPNQFPPFPRNGVIVQARNLYAGRPRK
jgi:hypothetical protein